jgi:hypothetical protein
VLLSAQLAFTWGEVTWAPFVTSRAPWARRSSDVPLSVGSSTYSLIRKVALDAPIHNQRSMSLVFLLQTLAYLRAFDGTLGF